ncbi:MAG: 5'/3'-nucleotidase SurE [Pirellulales bacterium]|nr:5'/3'-nucleotidase SurE [Pirellulales bacterium]
MGLQITARAVDAQSEQGYHDGSGSCPRFSRKYEAHVLILLTNDDGIYAPGLAAMYRELLRLGDVFVVAPATEQSGVAHSITYLTPLIAKEVYQAGRPWGWAVEGSPADCVKIGVDKLCPTRPDLVVSGINGGLNAGINVLYSGTVAAAIEGAFFGITSVAVSLEFDEQAAFDRAARLARGVIEQLLERDEARSKLYNLNIPTAALRDSPEIHVVPMDVTPYGDEYEKRTDPWGRDYYWATGNPPTAVGVETDLSVLGRGHVALTPLAYDMTAQAMLARMKDWKFTSGALESDGDAPPDVSHTGPVIRSMRKMQRVKREKGTGD